MLLALARLGLAWLALEPALLTLDLLKLELLKLKLLKMKLWSQELELLPQLHSIGQVQAVGSPKAVPELQEPDRLPLQLPPALEDRHQPALEPIAIESKPERLAPRSGPEYWLPALGCFRLHGKLLRPARMPLEPQSLKEQSFHLLAR